MHFTQTLIWKKSALIGKLTYAVLPLLPPEERFGMRSQMSRAAISVSSNIAEGLARETQRDRLYFMTIAQGSLSELHSQLLLCVEIGILTAERITTEVDEIIQLSKMLTAMRRQMRQNMLEEFHFDGRKIPYRYRSRPHAQQ